MSRGRKMVGWAPDNSRVSSIQALQENTDQTDSTGQTRKNKNTYPTLGPLKNPALLNSNKKVCIQSPDFPNEEEEEPIYIFPFFAYCTARNQIEPLSQNLRRNRLTKMSEVKNPPPNPRIPKKTLENIKHMCQLVNQKKCEEAYQKKILNLEEDFQQQVCG